MARAQAVIGRVLLSALFILSGVTKVLDPDTVVRGASLKVNEFKQIDFKGLLGANYAQAVQGAVYLAIAMELVGGLLFLIGEKKYSTLLLSLFLIGVTPIMHNATLHAPTSMEFQNEMAHTLKNAAILGGILIAGAGSGSGSKAKTQ